jgi:hypothetical protein
MILLDICSQCLKRSDFTETTSKQSIFFFVYLANFDLKNLISILLKDFLMKSGLNSPDFKIFKFFFQ